MIDPCAGSGVTLLAAEMAGRKGYGFEIKKEYVKAFNDTFKSNVQVTLDNLAAESIKNKWMEKQITLS